MCKRICFNCKSEDHTETFGITGFMVICDDCNAILEKQYDSQAAPLSCEDPEKYAEDRSFIKSPIIEE